MSFMRRIKVGRQTYLCCNVKSIPCEENGCIQCKEKYWMAIEKILYPLLLQCSSSLKDKNTRVEFFGSVPCTVDDLYIKISYELKPQNNTGFVVVQPITDDKTWETAWSNLSEDRNNYNFGGLFERVNFLNYILQININKLDEFGNGSSSSSDSQKNNEEKSSYFQEERNCKSNPLGVLLKRMHKMKKSKAVVKCCEKMPKVTSNVPKSSVVLATDDTSCHSLQEEVGGKTEKPDFKLSPIIPIDPLECENRYYNEEDINIPLPNLDGTFDLSEQENINNKLNLKRKCSHVSLQQPPRKKMFSTDRSNLLNSSNSEDPSNNIEKDDSIDQSSRLRKLFLDIVSRKRNSDLKESLDVAFLNSDLSPDGKNGSINEDIELNDNQDRRNNTQLVSSLTKPQLNCIFRKHLPKLKAISCRKKYCRRHEDFMRGGKANYDLTYQVNLSPFKEVQLDYVMELLMSEFYVKPNEDIDYILKVLLPEALIIIFMELHGTDYENSDRLMAEAAFNTDCVEIV